MLLWLENGQFENYSPSKTQAPGAYAFVLNEEPNEVMKVGQVMHTQLITVESETTASQALEAMKKHLVHHLPIVEEECLVGLVSDRDLIQAEDREETLVDDLMAERLLTAKRDSSIWQAAQIMLNHKINCILVVDDDQRLEGLVTSLDILALMTHQAPIQVWG